MTRSAKLLPMLGVGPMLTSYLYSFDPIHAAHCIDKGHRATIIHDNRQCLLQRYDINASVFFQYRDCRYVCSYIHLVVPIYTIDPLKQCCRRSHTHTQSLFVSPLFRVESRHFVRLKSAGQRSYSQTELIGYHSLCVGQMLFTGGGGHESKATIQPW